MLVSLVHPLTHPLSSTPFCLPFNPSSAPLTLSLHPLSPPLSPPSHTPLPPYFHLFSHRQCLYRRIPTSDQINTTSLPRPKESHSRRCREISFSFVCIKGVETVARTSHTCPTYTWVIYVAYAPFSTCSLKRPHSSSHPHSPSLHPHSPSYILGFIPNPSQSTALPFIGYIKSTVIENTVLYPLLSSTTQPSAVSRRICWSR